MFNTSGVGIEKNSQRGGSFAAFGLVQEPSRIERKSNIESTMVIPKRERAASNGEYLNITATGKVQTRITEEASATTRCACARPSWERAVSKVPLHLIAFVSVLRDVTHQ